MNDVEFQEISKSSGEGSSILNDNSPIFSNVEVDVFVRIGKTSISVKDLMSLKHGQTISLDHDVGQVVDLMFKDKVVARGQLVSENDMFAIKITEV